jgi:hypothetical protein
MFRLWDVARKVNVEKRKLRKTLREDFVHGTYFGINRLRRTDQKKSSSGDVDGDMIKELLKKKQASSIYDSTYA